MQNPMWGKACQPLAVRMAGRIYVFTIVRQEDKIMAMEISNRYGFDHINKAQTGQTERAEEKDKTEIILAPKDEYIC